MSELETDTTLDLDGLIVEAVQFKLLGKNREIKPIDLLTSFKFTKSMEELAVAGATKATSQALIDAYYKIFSTCVEPFTKDDLLAMTAAQMVSLYGLILRRVYGEDLAKTFHQQKKKTQASQSISQSKSTRVKSWLKRVFFSGGSLKSV